MKLLEVADCFKKGCCCKTPSPIFSCQRDLAHSDKLQLSSLKFEFIWCDFFFFLTLSNAERDTTLLWHGQLRKEPWHIFEHEQSERHLLWEAFRFSVQKLTLLGCVSGLEQSISPTQTRYLTRCSACSLLLCGSTLRIPGLQLSLWSIKQRDYQKFLWGFTASHRFLTVCTNSR